VDVVDCRWMAMGEEMEFLERGRRWDLDVGRREEWVGEVDAKIDILYVVDVLYGR
jgi:hypothetical protein